LENRKRRWFPWQPRKAVDRELQELLDRITKRPKNPGLHQRLAELYLDRGDTLKAIDAFVRAAECYKEAGFYLRAIALYRRILRMNRESPEILLKLTELYILNGLFGDALVQFRKVIRHYKRDGKENQCPILLEKLTRTDPQNHHLRIKLLELMEKEGLHLSAFNGLVELYSEIKKDPTNPHIEEVKARVKRIYKTLERKYKHLGKQIDIMHIKQRVEELLSEEPAGLILTPVKEEVDEESHEELVLTDEVREEKVQEELLLTDEVKEETLEEERGGPEDHIYTQLQEAKVYLDHGLWDEAEAIYSEILDQFPRHTEALKGMEMISKQRKISTLGQQLSQNFVQQQSDEQTLISSGGGNNYKALLEGKSGDQPVDAAVRYELALAYKQIGMLDECIEELVVASKDSSVAFECHKELAECYRKKGDRGKALEHFKLAASCPGVEQERILEVTYQLAKFLEECGEAQKALQIYKEIEQKDSTFRDVIERVKILRQ
jgi:tetratricopeptide (TPR) repeat protein